VAARYLGNLAPLDRVAIVVKGDICAPLVSVATAANENIFVSLGAHNGEEKSLCTPGVRVIV
jgi:hypothetical protein